MVPCGQGHKGFLFLFSDLFKPEFVLGVEFLVCVGAVGMLLEQPPTLLGPGPPSLLPATGGVLRTMRVAADQLQAACEHWCSSMLQFCCLCLA